MQSVDVVRTLDLNPRLQDGLCRLNNWSISSEVLHQIMLTRKLLKRGRERKIFDKKF